ncbi:MAG: hypothetical protein ACR2KT_13020 [Methylocella sp.]
MIRIIDATTVLKAGTAAKLQNKLWRIHSAFDLPSERFGFFELTGQQGGETRDRIPVVRDPYRRSRLSAGLALFALSLSPFGRIALGTSGSIQSD